MVDGHGRSIEYLRLSITERCTLRCVYCRAGEGLCPKERELGSGEFERIVRVLAEYGVNKVRITGGEPLLRRDMLEILSRIAAIPSIGEIAMTTNGQELPGQVAALRAAGLTRLNISLDTLDPRRYEEMTGGGKLQPVLDGIEEAAACLLPLKLNAVLLRGVNEGEIDDFIALARERPIDVRFIELMPMGGAVDMARRVSTDEILAARPWLKALPPRYRGQPSVDYTADGFRGRVGFISPISHKFCGECNRVRVMSDGMLRPCLGRSGEISLLEALQEKDDAALRECIWNAVYNKPAGHGFALDGFSSGRNMGSIGG